jgi:aryl-alcohol dehydrogenase-like predicted oxidoreductase
MRPFPALGRDVAPVAFGSFKIGRNQGIKYAHGYELPSPADARALLHAVCDLGIDIIDTAPAYGLAESRIGQAMVTRRDTVVLATKVGEQRCAGRSTYDFSRASVERSLRESMSRLCTDRIDVVHVHSDGSDLAILRDGGALDALDAARGLGQVGAIGFSPKTLEGAMACLSDPRIGSLMLEYHPKDMTMSPALDGCRERGVAVLVKKPLASGTIAPSEAIPFVLAHPAVTAAVVGTLSVEHLREICVLAGVAPRERAGTRTA